MVLSGKYLSSLYSRNLIPLMPLLSFASKLRPRRRARHTFILVLKRMMFSLPSFSTLSLPSLCGGFCFSNDTAADLTKGSFFLGSKVEGPPLRPRRYDFFFSESGIRERVRIFGFPYVF